MNVQDGLCRGQNRVPSGGLNDTKTSGVRTSEAQSVLNMQVILTILPRTKHSIWATCHSKDEQREKHYKLC